MEGQEQFNPQELIREFRAASERPLAVTQVLPFVATADPANLRAIATWYRGGAAIDDRTPVALFNQALTEEFDNLSPEEKERVLINGLRFALLDMSRTNIAPNPTGYYDFLSGTVGHFGQEKLIFFQAGVLSKKGLIYTRNIAAYLSKVLEHAGGDLKAAEDLIARAPYIGNITTRESVGIATNFLYRSNKIQIDPRRPEISKGAISIRQGFQARHPKNRALAFWVDAHLGTFDLDGRNADLRLREILREEDPSLKTEILAYLKEQLAEDPPGYSEKHALIERVVRENEALYSKLKEKYPNAQFIQEYEVIVRLLKLRSIESKTQGGKIEPADLATLLTTYPNLVHLVSNAELEEAIRYSGDPEAIKTFETALLQKKRLG